MQNRPWRNRGKPRQDFRFSGGILTVTEQLFRPASWGQGGAARVATSGRNAASPRGKKISAAETSKSLERIRLHSCRRRQTGNPKKLTLDEALDRLAGKDPREARIVELRFFGGLSVEETAAVLDISTITVIRDRIFVKAWLRREIKAATD